MLLEISSLKNFEIFIGKHLCWGPLIKLQAFRPSTFSCGYCENFKNNFFHRTPPMVASGSPTTVLLYYYSPLGCLLFDFLPPHAFEFDQKLTQNVAQIIFYCHVTIQFLPCLNRFITCFWFQNIFWKNLHEALHKQLCNTICQKIFLACNCGWSSVFSLRICFG